MFSVWILVRNELSEFDNMDAKLFERMRCLPNDLPVLPL